MEIRNKIVTKEAELFTRQRYEKVKAFVGHSLSPMIVPRCIDGKSTCKIKTLEGDMTATEGDYIIKGLHGEFYPCKPDIFDKTYDILN